MRASMGEILEAHRRSGTAAGAFTCYGMEGATAVLAAAEERRSHGVILLLSSEALASPLGPPLLATLVALADASSVPACVQLDHCPSLDAIQQAFEGGAGAALADGSELPFEENLALSVAAVRLAETHGAQIEVELGHVAGDEEAAAPTRARGLTDPAQAAEFAERSAAACLAVSIGNVHGRYAVTPNLDFGLLAQIRDAVSIPLALHGASGLPDETVRNAISGGVTKINVNTELRSAFIAALEDGIEDAREGLRVLDLTTAASRAVKDVVAAKLDLFEPDHEEEERP